ncbi:hypothetical protein C7212DRAFT_175308, partial [Tuber magnatum]
GLVMNHWRDKQEAFLKFKRGCHGKRLESVAGYCVLPTSELTSIFLFPGIYC